MYPKISWLALAFSFLFSFHAGAVCVEVTNIPISIESPGTYCLNRDLTTDIASGAAIRINVDNVVLDLNGFMIKHTRNSGTRAIGIYSLNRTGITIKNGQVANFQIGIQHDVDSPTPSSAGGNHRIENIRAIENTLIGIEAGGGGNIIKKNQVIQTGGSTFSSNAFGILVFAAPGTRIVDNDIQETIEKNDGVAHAIQLVESNDSVVKNNRIRNSDPARQVSRGVFVTGPSLDVAVINNRIVMMTEGVVYNTGSTGKFRNNVTINVLSPFIGGTDTGNNEVINCQ